MKRFLRLFAVAVFLVGVLPVAHAQQHDLQKFKKEADTVYYHLQINQSNKGHVHRISIPNVRLAYEDRYGKTGSFDLALYNWNGELVRKKQLPKKYGQNQYDFKLTDWHSNWETEKIYSLRSTTDQGKSMITQFLLTEAIEFPSPEVEILVNPVELNCEKPEETRFEFYGVIEGGFPPYDIEWDVNGNGAAPRKPMSFHIPISGYTSGIEVDLAPNYNVILRVRDGCGTEVEKMVYITCEEKNKNYNTLFFQQLRRDKGNNRLIN
ncbi:hypothetical protein KIH41_17350 [Litoribacter ruber]|uniref:hypothetical protein n=1 Tax=Litoribacter ruber TaxID=702568 RepID=UPI001BDA85B0|nr:hypothetical protein [Litoribacter ruber]MBT0813058.1 hypothetical protein [Litoribacter ruber]